MCDPVYLLADAVQVKPGASTAAAHRQTDQETSAKGELENKNKLEHTMDDICMILGKSLSGRRRQNKYRNAKQEEVSLEVSLHHNIMQIAGGLWEMGLHKTWSGCHFGYCMILPWRLLRASP